MDLVDVGESERDGRRRRADHPPAGAEEHASDAHSPTDGRPIVRPRIKSGMNGPSRIGDYVLRQQRWRIQNQGQARNPQLRGQRFQSFQDKSTPLG